MVLWRPSPNWNVRPAGAAPTSIVLHYTGMLTAAAALARLRDPAAEVSAHYLIDEDGTVIGLVPEAARAWHAGVSRWRGRGNLNDVSLGIELVNPGHAWGYRPFPPAQMAALAWLGGELRRRWGIASADMLAHSDIAPTRKEDPGELLDWRWLAGQGLGLWPQAAPPAAPEPLAARTALARIGYPLEPEGVPLAAALRAFQRRYRPTCVDGALDRATMGLILAVAGLHAGEPART